MKLINKTIIFLFLIINAFFYAQDTPPVPSQPSEVGRPGGVGPGGPASPIDMYLYLLAIVALGLIWYYHSKTRKSLG